MESSSETGRVVIHSLHLLKLIDQPFSHRRFSVNGFLRDDPLEGKLDILRRQRVPVVEGDASSDFEFPDGRTRVFP